MNFTYTDYVIAMVDRSLSINRIERENYKPFSRSLEVLNDIRKAQFENDEVDEEMNRRFK